MNDEQNKPDDVKPDDQQPKTDAVFLTEDSSLQTEEEFEAAKRGYDNVDEKKPLTTTVGDGVMRDEGLAETGDDISASSDYTHDDSDS